MWVLNNRELKKAPKNAFGFIYEIEFEDDTKYIGKKNFYSRRKRNFGKKELALITDKRRKKYEIVTKESDWKGYNSSNKLILSRIKAGDLPVTKKVLSIARCKKELTYLEERELFLSDALRDGSYLNDNIAGKFYTKDFEAWELIKE